MNIRVRVLFYCLQIVLIIVLVVWLDNVAIWVKSRRIVLQDISLVARMFYALYSFSDFGWHSAQVPEPTFLYRLGSDKKSGSPPRAYWTLRFRSCLLALEKESPSSVSAVHVSERAEDGTR
jgi:hypothetical protein